MMFLWTGAWDLDVGEKSEMTDVSKESKEKELSAKNE